MRPRYRLIPSLAAAALMLGTTLGAANAEDPTPSGTTTAEVAADAAVSLNEQGLPTGTLDAPGVEVSTDSDTPATYDTPTGTLRMDVPSATDGVATADGVVFDASGQDASVLVQSTDEGGLRALVHIDSAEAPERYAFPISGDVTSIELDAAGGAAALDASGNTVAYADAPWAVDANGTPVPTHFEVDGTTLYQVIEHRSGTYSYGIVADPWWNPFSWNWGKIGSAIAKGAKQTAKVAVCAAAVTAVIVPAAKGAKLVKELGGVTKTAQLLVGAGTMSDLKAMAPALAAEILGLSTVKSKCF